MTGKRISKRSEGMASGKSDFRKEFMAAFNSLTEKYGRQKVWSDFIEMTACAFSNSGDKRFWEEREDIYLKCAASYSAEELEKFVGMLSQLTVALTIDPEQDFLGEIFSALSLHNEWRGQFFTPYHIGSAMAKMNMTNLEKDLHKKDQVSILDPCCGAGCLLIAAANEVKRINEKALEKALFVAQDIDRVAALMCYIQLSILGCKAVVKISNTLSDPFVNEDMQKNCVWLTPALMRAN